MRTSKELNTGRESGNGKRKADGEAIIGRAVTMQKRNGDRGIEDLACYRCGEVGHLKTDRVTGSKCQATRCTLCHSFIGTNAHSARGCCNRSNQVFPNGNFSAGKSKSAGSRGGNKSNGNANSSEGKGKKDKKSSGKEKASHYGPANGVSNTVSSVPKVLQQMRALLAQMESNHARSRNVSARSGELEALVVPGIKENLVSISDLTSKGSTLELSNSRGVISNPMNDKKIHLKKKNGVWRLKLKVLLELSIQPSRVQRRTVILIFMNVWDINLGRL